MEKRFVWLVPVAYGAFVQGASMALHPDHLQIVSRRHRRGDRVRAVVADDTLHTGMPDRILVELAWLLVLMSWNVVACSAFRLVGPRLSDGISNIFHASVTCRTRQACRVMDVSKALGLVAGMAGVALIDGLLQAADRVGNVRPFPVRTVHGRRHRRNSGDARCSEGRVSVTFGTKNGLLIDEVGSMLGVVLLKNVHGCGHTLFGFMT